MKKEMKSAIITTMVGVIIGAVAWYFWNKGEQPKLKAPLAPFIVESSEWTLEKPKEEQAQDTLPLILSRKAQIKGATPEPLKSVPVKKSQVDKSQMSRNKDKISQKPEEESPIVGMNQLFEVKPEETLHSIGPNRNELASVDGVNSTIDTKPAENTFWNVPEPKLPTHDLDYEVMSRALQGKSVDPNKNGGVIDPHKINPSPVPEPMSIFLVGSGLIMLVNRLRKQK